MCRSCGQGRRALSSPGLRVRAGWQPAQWATPPHRSATRRCAAECGEWPTAPLPRPAAPAGAARRSCGHAYGRWRGGNTSVAVGIASRRERSTSTSPGGSVSVRREASVLVPRTKTVPRQGHVCPRLPQRLADPHARPSHVPRQVSNIRMPGGVSSLNPVARRTRRSAGASLTRPWAVLARWHERPPLAGRYGCRTRGTTHTGEVSPGAIPAAVSIVVVGTGQRWLPPP